MNFCVSATEEPLNPEECFYFGLNNLRQEVERKEILQRKQSIELGIRAAKELCDIFNDLYFFLQGEVYFQDVENLKKLKKEFFLGVQKKYTKEAFGETSSNLLGEKNLKNILWTLNNIKFVYATNADEDLINEWRDVVNNDLYGNTYYSLVDIEKVDPNAINLQPIKKVYEENNNIVIEIKNYLKTEGKATLTKENVEKWFKSYLLNHIELTDQKTLKEYLYQYCENTFEENYLYEFLKIASVFNFPVLSEDDTIKVLNMIKDDKIEDTSEIFDSVFRSISQVTKKFSNSTSTILNKSTNALNNLLKHLYFLFSKYNLKNLIKNITDNEIKKIAHVLVKTYTDVDRIIKRARSFPEFYQSDCLKTKCFLCSPDNKHVMFLNIKLHLFFKSEIRKIMRDNNQIDCFNKNIDNWRKCLITKLTPFIVEKEYTESYEALKALFSE